MSTNKKNSEPKQQQYVEVKSQQVIKKLQALNNKQPIIQDDRQTSKPILKNKSEKTNNQRNKPQEKINKQPNTRPAPKKQSKNKQYQSRQRPQQRYEGQRMHKQNIRRNYQNYFKKNYDRQIKYPFYKCKDNEIYINDNNTQKYFKKLNSIIDKFEFINLVAYGNNIVTAIAVSEEANKKINKLYRVNCPGTIAAESVYKGINNKNEDRKVQILQPSLTIQLSLKQLALSHMGYQDNLQFINYNRKDRKKNYKGKQEENKNENKGENKKKKNYKEKYDDGELR